jgi:hypothetical protein
VNVKIFVLALLASCAQSPQNGTLECAAAASACPTHYHCAADDHCWKDGTDPVLTDMRALVASDMPANDGSPSSCGAIGSACCTSGTACEAGCCNSATKQCQTAYASVVQADNPVGYWLFDETSGTSVARVGGGSLGALYGGVTLNVAGALSCGDTAAAFDGTSGYIDFGNLSLADFGTSDFTIEFWAITRTPSSSFAYYLSKRSSCAFGDFWDILLAGNGTGFEVDNEDAGHVYGSSNWPLTLFGDGKWHHFVFERQATTALFYLDGVLQSSNATMTPTTTANVTSIASMQTGLVLTGCSNQGPTYFSGSMDELAIYHTALSASRVTAHFAAR